MLTALHGQVCASDKASLDVVDADQVKGAAEWVFAKFPVEELLVAGRRYHTAGGTLNTLRESQSHRNTPAGRGELAPSNGAGPNGTG